MSTTYIPQPPKEDPADKIREQMRKDRIDFCVGQQGWSTGSAWNTVGLSDYDKNKN